MLCNVIRIAARYGNLATLEEGYGINLLPLAKLAMEYYGDDPCLCFREQSAYQNLDQAKHLTLDTSLEEKMHKAITIMQFKIEGQMILSIRILAWKTVCCWIRSIFPRAV